jgi:hypothetical protein
MTTIALVGDLVPMRPAFDREEPPDARVRGLVDLR